MKGIGEPCDVAVGWQGTQGPTVRRTDLSPFVLLQPKMSIDDYINQLFAKADKNHDGRLKFTEFLTTLNLAAIDAHKRSHEPTGGQGPHPVGGHDHGHDHGHGPRN